MKRLYAIYLIACFMLLDNNGATGHSLKKFFQVFSGLKQLKSLKHGILPGIICLFLINLHKMQK